jgi:hypothetical protein
LVTTPHHTSPHHTVIDPVPDVNVLLFVIIVVQDNAPILEIVATSKLDTFFTVSPLDCNEPVVCIKFALAFIAPHHTSPHHTTPHHTTHHHTTPHITTLHHTTPHHSTPHHTTSHHITLTLTLTLKYRTPF